MKANFDRFSTFIFDLDGTLWTWDKLIPGAKELIENLQKRKKQVLFITNNTLLSHRELTRKLWRFGIDADYKQLINVGTVAARYFKKIMKRDECVLVIGNGLREDLRRYGIRTTARVAADYVIVGQDMNFDYMKLSTATEALKRGAKLYTCARGRHFVMGKCMWPGTGVLVEAIEYASGEKAKLLGKPARLMLDSIRAANKSMQSRTVIVGDESADIITGKKLGYFTVLVKTGVGIVGSKIKPDAALRTLDDLTFKR